MLTNILAKARTHFGLPPTATLSQVGAAIDAATTPETPATGEDEGAAAGAETVEETTATPTAATTEEAAEALTTEQVQAMIDTAVAAQAQAVTDLNAANAELSARLKVVEGLDADEHTKGPKEAVKVTDGKTRAYRNNPINQ